MKSKVKVKVKVKAKSKSEKKVIVTRKWLMDFANTIYNPKTRDFLNLCRDELQNGPDPENPKRSMHCGLGELYFQLTGKQPRKTNINEEGVVDLAIKQSSLWIALEKQKTEFVKSILVNKKAFYGYFNGEIDDLVGEVTNSDLMNHDEICKLKNILDNIPIENDDVDEGLPTIATYRNRARRVASSLRKAAKLLPE